MESFKYYFLKCLRSNYANFNGRARRKEYWGFLLVQIVLFVGLLIVTGILGAIAKPLSYVGGLLYFVVAIGLMLPTIAAGIRRLHDIGKPGIWFLIGLVPLVGVVLLYFLALPGQPGDNAYGPDPLASEEAQMHP